MEVVFTAADRARSASTRDASLEGHTYLWMLPLYGLAAYLFEPVHEAARTQPLWRRAAAYSAGIMATEYATGRALHKATGSIPWDYTGRGRAVIGGGATRLDYAAHWAIAGVGMERLHDALRRVRIQVTAP